MKYVFNIILVICCFSCELEVEVDVPVQKPRLTVNSYFTPDSIWYADISLSKFILEGGNYSPVNDAQVIIYQDEIPVDTLFEKSDGFYKSDTGKPLDNKAYTIKVQSERYGTVTAESSAPALTPMSVETNELDDAIIFTITFEDKSGENNFYEIKAEMESVYRRRDGTEFVSKRLIYLESDDPVFRNNTDDSYSNTLIFDDTLFPGKKISLDVRANDIRLGNQKIYIHLTTLSKDLSEFKNTLNLQKNASGDPFAAPVNVYTNINQGFGIFGGYSESIYIYKK